MRNRNYSDLFTIILIIIIAFLSYLVFFNKKDEQYYTINLLGEQYEYIEKGTSYSEPGYIAYDVNNNNVNNNVHVKSNLNNNVIGVYEIIYSIGNNSVTRNIEVVEKFNPKIIIELSKNKNEITNDDVIITINIIGQIFQSLSLPDGQIINKKNSTYTVSENGTYQFTAYNKKGEIYTESITISNIDKERPHGSCKAVKKDGVTKISVLATDNNQIAEYVYFDNGKKLIGLVNNFYEYNKETSDNVQVLVKDIAGNEEKILCEVKTNDTKDPIKPNMSEKIVFIGETDTLKVYVVERNTYYLTYIWAENPYLQLNKFDSPEYGRNLYKPEVLLNKANIQYNLSDKLLFGFNASGFYLKDVYDAYSVNKYPAYDKTSVGTLVITDGRIVRNAYSKAVKTWFTIGINKDNKMLVFEDTATNDTSAKQNWANMVISSGIRNTFTFAAPIIENGQRTDIRTSMPGSNSENKGLQMICQINENNFALFTASKETRDTGIAIFQSLGCQTAMNLDGGGSIALVYKNKNSNEINTIIGNKRSLSEVAYFSE